MCLIRERGQTFGEGLTGGRFERPFETGVHLDQVPRRPRIDAAPLVHPQAGARLDALRQALSSSELDGMMRAVFLNSGQVCLCAERVYVEGALYERFCVAFTERVRSLRLGWPHETDSAMGPLISAEHRDKVLQYFALAREEGAQFLAGGGVPSFGDARDRGFWVEPTPDYRPRRAASRRRSLAPSVTLHPSTRSGRRSNRRMTPDTVWPPASGRRT